MDRRRRSPGRIVRSLVSSRSRSSVESDAPRSVLPIRGPVVASADAGSPAGRVPGRYSAVTCASDPTATRGQPRQGRRAQRALARTPQEGARRDRRRRLPGHRPGWPEVSLREIAEEAGTAKPKIYRHFNDKSDLFQAIGKRDCATCSWAAIFPNIDVATDPTREVVRRSVAEYVNLVEQHPNVLRFVLQGRFPEPAESTTRGAQRGPRDHHGDGRDVQQRAAGHATGPGRPGAGGGGHASARPRRPPTGGSGPIRTARRGCRRATFVTHLTTIMLGTISGTADLLEHRPRPGPADAQCGRAAPRRSAGRRRRSSRVRRRDTRGTQLVVLSRLSHPRGSVLVGQPETGIQRGEVGFR